MARQEHENEESELWREYRRAQRQRRAERLGPRTDAILALRNKGYEVEALSEFQFRIDRRLDLYPIHQRYHDLRTGRRGGYRSPIEIAVHILRKER